MKLPISFTKKVDRKETRKECVYVCEREKERKRERKKQKKKERKKEKETISFAPKKNLSREQFDVVFYIVALTRTS